MNPEQSKYFEDVDVEGMGFGGLGGAAIENHHRANARPTAEGVKVKLDCGTCGAPNVMTIEWPEAIIIAHGAIPKDWVYEKGYIRPEVGCAQCRRLVSPGITPDEAARWVKAAQNARFVTPQQIQSVAAHLKRG
jgi:hypothetical protein